MESKSFSKSFKTLYTLKYIPLLFKVLKKYIILKYIIIQISYLILNKTENVTINSGLIIIRFRVGHIS